MADDINKYHAAHNYSYGALEAYAEENGEFNAVDFERYFCKEFDRYGDIKDYFLDVFMRVNNVPDHVAWYLNSSEIMEDMLIHDYYIVNGDRYYLFLRPIV